MPTHNTAHTTRLSSASSQATRLSPPIQHWDRRHCNISTAATCTAHTSTLITLSQQHTHGAGSAQLRHTQRRTSFHFRHLLCRSARSVDRWPADSLLSFREQPAVTVPGLCAHHSASTHLPTHFISLHASTPSPPPEAYPHRLLVCLHRRRCPRRLPVATFDCLDAVCSECPEPLLSCLLPLQSALFRSRLSVSL